MTLLPSFFDHLEDWLNLAVFDINEEHRNKMAILELQGLPAQLAKLKHDTIADAKKLSSRVISVGQRKDAAFAKSHTFLDGTEGHIAEVEQFVSDIEAVTNGGPPLEEPASTPDGFPKPGPHPSYP